MIRAALALAGLAGLLSSCQRSRAPRGTVSGRDVYLAHGCAACHGLDGDGRGMTGRSLDPPPTDFHDLATYRFGHDRAIMLQTITAGIQEENSRMPAFGDIPPAELNALVDYLITLQPGAPTSPISVSGAWVRAVPPSSSVSAAYMTINNDSGEAAYLESAATTAARSAEIHLMASADGMMTMKMVDGVAIPAHGRVSLDPSGYHLMLIGLRKPLQPGASVKLALRFRDGRALTIAAPVRAEAGAGGEPGQ